MTLTGTPAKIASSMAGSPSGVPGDLDEQVRPTGASVQLLRRRQRARRVVRELRRDLQRDPAVDAVGRDVDRTGRDRPPAVKSSRARSKNSSSPDLPAASFLADRGVVVAGCCLMALSKIVGFEVSPVTESSSM